MEGTDKERQAHIASFIDKVRGNVIPADLSGVRSIVSLLETSPVCTCRAIEGLAGFMNIRCFSDQTTQIISSIMVQPRSFSAQQEKLLTMMNTDSWERVFGEQMQFVGLHLEMWICHISLRNKDAINRISDLMQGSNDDAEFMNLSVCVEAGIATAGTTDKHDVIFDKRYRVPVERSHAQLIHPAAHNLLKKILILIDAMIDTAEDAQERRELEDERFKIISAWTTVKRFKGGMNYVKVPEVAKAFQYLDEGYRESRWAKMVAGNNDPYYGSLVKTKEDGSGLSIQQVENRDLTCAFFARQEIMQIVAQLPPSVICLYSGENDLDCISSSFEDRHAILDTTLNPAYRQVMSHQEDYATDGLELAVRPQWTC